MIPVSSVTSIIRPELGMVAYAAMIDGILSGYVATKLFPIFPVARSEASYPVIPLSALYNLHNTIRASSANYNRVVEQFEAGYYRTSEYGLEYPLDDRFTDIYRSVFDYETTSVKLLMGKILREKEKRVSDLLFDYPFQAIAAEASWKSGGTSANPKKDIDDAKTELRKLGIMPTHVVMSYVNFYNAINTPAVQNAVYAIFPDAMKTGQITLMHLETYLDIKVLVGNELYNTAKKGQTPVLLDIWPNDKVLVCKLAEEGEDISVPSIGRTFLWNGGSSNQEIIVEQYREEQTRGNIVRVRYDSAEHMLKSVDNDNNVLSKIGGNCGLFITGVNTEA